MKSAPMQKCTHHKVLCFFHLQITHEVGFNPYEEENLPGSRSSNYASSQEVESAEKLQYKQVH